MKKKNRNIWKKSPEELAEYLMFQRRGSKIPDKKKYNRNKMKNRKDW